MSSGIRYWWLLLAAMIGYLSLAQADALYRWTDSEGRLHYGDRPPPGDAEQAERLRMPSYVAPGRPVDEDPYSILNQVERLEAYRQNQTRERREKEREEREYDLRKRELEVRQEALQAPVAGSGYSGPIYSRPPIYGPDWPYSYPRPPGLWKPDHPAYRPPGNLRPPVAVPYPSRAGGGVRLPRQ